MRRLTIIRLWSVQATCRPSAGARRFGLGEESRHDGISPYDAESVQDLSPQTISLLFISHDLAAVGAVCDRLAILREGEIVETGSTAEIFAAPDHPYTAELLGAMSGWCRANPQIVNVPAHL